MKYISLLILFCLISSEKFEWNICDHVDDPYLEISKAYIEVVDDKEICPDNLATIGIEGDLKHKVKNGLWTMHLFEENIWKPVLVRSGPIKRSFRNKDNFNLHTEFVLPEQQVTGRYHAFLLGMEKCSFNTIYCAEIHYNYTQNDQIAEIRSLKQQQPGRKNWMNIDEIESLQIQDKVINLLKRISKHNEYKEPLKLVEIVEGEYSNYPKHHYHIIIDVIKEGNKTQKAILDFIDKQVETELNLFDFLNEDETYPKCYDDENEIKEMETHTIVDVIESVSDDFDEDIWITIDDKDMLHHQIITHLIEYTNNQINAPNAYTLLSVDSIEHNIVKSYEDRYTLYLNIYDKVEKHSYVTHNHNNTISIDEHDVIEKCIGDEDYVEENHLIRYFTPFISEIVIEMDKCNDCLDCMRISRVSTNSIQRKCGDFDDYLFDMDVYKGNNIENHLVYVEIENGQMKIKKDLEIQSIETFSIK